MQREQEEFRQWLEIGTLPLPDTGTKEGTAAWLELKDLYEFCRWMTAHRQLSRTCGRGGQEKEENCRCMNDKMANRHGVVPATCCRHLRLLALVSAAGDAYR